MTMGNHKDILIENILWLKCWGFWGPRFRLNHRSQSLLRMMINSSWRILSTLSEGKRQWGTNLGDVKRQLQRGHSKWNLLWTIGTTSAMCAHQGCSLETWCPGEHWHLLPSTYPHSKCPTGKFIFGITHITHRENVYPISHSYYLWNAGNFLKT